ncbi:MAG: GntR family transcriptional regulator [Clostridiaceae bacterium]|nr:GntR family transcriptional regulator [Clostridiaceae bacterium]
MQNKYNEGEKDMKVGTRYKQIALDVAKQIASGKILEGAKLKGRSVLAGNYNVSPETIRKAIALLEEMKVVQPIPGSGSLVLSKERSKAFIEKYQSKEKLQDFKMDINDLLQQKSLIDIALHKKIKSLMDLTNTIHGEDSVFQLIEIAIKETNHINQSIIDSNFWQETRSSIIAIKREGKLIVAPNPREVLLENDIVIAVKGKENTEL